MSAAMCIGDEGLRQVRRLVDEFIVHSALEISKHILDSLPMSKTRIGVESGKNSGCIGNVWPCGKGQGYIRDPTMERYWDISAASALFWDDMDEERQDPGVEWSGYRLAIL
jgi:hypothetical protein